MTSKITQAPFADGNLLDWDGYGRSGDIYRRYDEEQKKVIESVIEMRKIEPFTAAMTLTDYRRGRSAAQFIWKDLSGFTYPMFMRDAIDLLKNRTIESGKIADTWIVQKRGANYGIRIAAITQPPRARSTWRSDSTCRNCGRVGQFKFKMVRDGFETVSSDVAFGYGGSRYSYQREKWLKDDKGEYVYECESEEACAKRAKNG